MGEHATDPLVLALLALLAVTTVLQILVRRKANGNGHAAKPGFTEEEAGQIKEKVARLEVEAQMARDWRHDEYVKEQTRLMESALPRNEADLMRKESVDDRARIWHAIEELRRRRP